MTEGQWNIRYSMIERARSNGLDHSNEYQFPKERLNWFGAIGYILLALLLFADICLVIYVLPQ